MREPEPAAAPSARHENRKSLARRIRDTLSAAYSLGVTRLATPVTRDITKRTHLQHRESDASTTESYHQLAALMGLYTTLGIRPELTKLVQSPLALSLAGPQRVVVTRSSSRKSTVFSPCRLLVSAANAEGWRARTTDRESDRVLALSLTDAARRACSVTSESDRRDPKGSGLNRPGIPGDPAV